jgi:excisionase family DNA binding protein
VGNRQHNLNDQIRLNEDDATAVYPVPRLLTPRQVADLLQITVKSVHALCRAGRLGYYWINAKERRFAPADVEAYLQARRVETQRPAVSSEVSPQIENSPPVQSFKSNPSVDKKPMPLLRSKVERGQEREESKGKAFRARLKKEMCQC